MTAAPPSHDGAAETALFGPQQRHAGPHGHRHHGPRRRGLRPSALRASATTRLAVALVLAAGLWLAVAWALDWL